MQPTLWQRMDHQGRRWLPFAITLVLLLLTVTPTHIPGLAGFSPMFALIAVYFWSIYQPDLFGYGSAFVIGVMEDILLGLPLGTGALVLLVVRAVVMSQQKFFYNKPFVITWVAFVSVAFGAALVRWATVSLLGETDVIAFGPVFGAFLMTVSIYPLIGWLLAQANAGFVEDNP